MPNTLPTDANSTIYEGVRDPAGQQFVAKQAGTVTTDAGGIKSAPEAVQSADGALATVGTTTDAAYAGGATSTLVAALKGIFGRIPVLGQALRAGSLPVTVASDQGLLGAARIQDGVGAALATVAQFHNADNQSPGGAANGILTGGVAQLLNIAGNLDRQRETGSDGIASVGIATGSAQFAMAFVTTDATDNFLAGTRTFTPVAMKGVLNGVPWSIQQWSVLTLDTGAAQEGVLVTATTATTFTCTTTQAHNGAVTPFLITGFVFNQERDIAGELDGSPGIGMASAAVVEYNGQPLANGSVLSGINYDRGRNIQALGVGAGTLANNPLAANAVSLTLQAAPTTLQPGTQIVLDRLGANPEVNYVRRDYTLASTTVPLVFATQFSHALAATVEWSQHTPLGPGLNGFSAVGIGIEEEALYNPVDQRFYIERSATQDNAVSPNIVLESEALFNAFGAAGNGFERARSVAGKQLVGTANFVNKAQNGGNLTVTAPGAAGATALTFSADPSVATLGSLSTPLKAGMPIILWNAGTPPTNIEVVFVLATYIGGVTVPISTTQVAHAAVTDAAWESFAPLGPGLTGFLPTGMDVDEDAVFDPGTQLFYLERSATADGLAGQNIVAETDTLFNGATFDRPRSATASPTNATGSALVSTGLAPLQSFSAQSALNTNGTVLDNAVARVNHSLFVVSSAGVSAGVVTLQGSNDNANWFNTSCTVTTNAASATFAANLPNFPWRYIRASITTVITGGTVTATVASA